MLEIVGFNDEDGRRTLRHTASHVLAQAVKHLRPEAKLAIGPAIENGFTTTLTSTSRSRPSSSRRSKWRCRSSSSATSAWSASSCRARGARADEGRPYKVELINDLPEGETISFYRQGDFTDPLRRPAPAQHRQDQGRQAHQHRRRVLARAARRTRCSSASTAPRSPTARRSTNTSRASRRPRSATTASSAASSTCSTSARKAGLPVLLPEGHGAAQPAGGLLARDPPQARL